MKHNLLFLSLAVLPLITSCNPQASENAWMIGRWQRSESNDTIEIKPDSTCKGFFEIVMFKEVIQAEGREYSEGRWKIMGDGTPYLLHQTIGETKFVVDSSTVAVVPSFSEIKKIEAGNYEKRTCANIRMNARWNSTSPDTLEVYGHGNSLDAKRVITFLRLVRRNEQLYLLELNLTGVVEGLYSKSSTKDKGENK